MASKQPADPQRARFLELWQELAERAAALRDHAMNPDSAWLAKAELQQVGQLLSELEAALEDIHREDAQSG